MTTKKSSLHFIELAGAVLLLVMAGCVTGGGGSSSDQNADMNTNGYFPGESNLGGSTNPATGVANPGDSMEKMDNEITGGVGSVDGETDNATGSASSAGVSASECANLSQSSAVSIIAALPQADGDGSTFTNEGVQTYRGAQWCTFLGQNASLGNGEKLYIYINPATQESWYYAIDPDAGNVEIHLQNNNVTEVCQNGDCQSFGDPTGGSGYGNYPTGYP